MRSPRLNTLVKTVTMYQAADGSVHRTEQAAQRQSEEHLLHNLEAFLKVTFPDAHRPSLIKAVEKLADSPHETVVMLSSLLEILEHKNSEKD